MIVNITGVATNGDAKITINNGMLSLSIDSFNPTSSEGEPNLTSIVFNFPSVKIENTASQTSFVGNISIEALQRTTMQVTTESYNACLASQTVDNGAYQSSYNYYGYTGDDLAAFTAAFTVGYNAGYADGLQDKYNDHWDTSSATKTGTLEGYWRGQNEGQNDRRNCADLNEDLNLKTIALSGEFSNASNTFTMGVNATMGNYATFVRSSKTAVALGSMKITMDANLNGMPNAKSTLDVVMTGDKKGNATWTLEQEGKGSMIISTKGDASSTTLDEISVKDSNGAEIIIQETSSNGKVLVDGKEVGTISNSKITYSDGSFESFR